MSGVSQLLATGSVAPAVGNVAVTTTNAGLLTITTNGTSLNFAPVQTSVLSVNTKSGSMTIGADVDNSVSVGFIPAFGNDIKITGSTSNSALFNLTNFDTTNSGLWASSNAYYKGQCAFSGASSNDLYMARQNVASGGTDPSTDGTNWLKVATTAGGAPTSGSMVLTGSAWDNTTSYAFGKVVSYTGGLFVWNSGTASVAGVAPDTPTGGANPNAWVCVGKIPIDINNATPYPGLMYNQGNWSGTASYHAGDVVQNAGTSYVCVAQQSSNASFPAGDFVALGSAGGVQPQINSAGAGSVVCNPSSGDGDIVLTTTGGSAGDIKIDSSAGTSGNILLTSGNNITLDASQSPNNIVDIKTTGGLEVKLDPTQITPTLTLSAPLTQFTNNVALAPNTNLTFQIASGSNSATMVIQNDAVGGAQPFQFYTDNANTSNKVFLQTSAPTGYTPPTGVNGSSLPNFQYGDSNGTKFADVGVGRVVVLGNNASGALSAPATIDCLVGTSNNPVLTLTASGANSEINLVANQVLVNSQPIGGSTPPGSLAISQSNAGAWSGSASYAQGQVVEYQNSLYVWTSATASVAGTAPDGNFSGAPNPWSAIGKLGVVQPTTAPFPGSMYFQNTWNGTTTYNAGDVVVNNSNTYVCIKQNSSNATFPPLDFQLLSGTAVALDSRVTLTSPALPTGGDLSVAIPSVNAGGKAWQKLFSITNPLYATYSSNVVYTGTLSGNLRYNANATAPPNYGYFSMTDFQNPPAGGQSSSNLFPSSNAYSDSIPFLFSADGALGPTSNFIFGSGSGPAPPLYDQNFNMNFTLPPTTSQGQLNLVAEYINTNTSNANAPEDIEFVSLVFTSVNLLITAVASSNIFTPSNL